MKKRVIQRLKSEDMRAYTEIYLHAYPAGKDFSEEGFERYLGRHLRSLNESSHINFFGLFEEGVLAGIMKLVDFDINLFGTMTKATGLMSLGVHPLRKKRGVAKEMVEFFEEYTVDSGGLVSMLLPFRIDFYRKMGYGYGTKLDEYRIPTSQLPETKELSNLRLLKTNEVDQVLPCYSAFVKKNHGALEKFEDEIRDILDDEKTRRIGYFVEEELKGYVAFDFVSDHEVNYTLNRLEVSELVYSDARVLRALLGAIRLQADLAQTTVIRTGEADFYHLLGSPQDISRNYIDYGFLQTNTSALATMYKIPSVKAFVEGTRYREFPPEELKIAFEVEDELKGTCETFGLHFKTAADGRGSRWSYTQDADTSDIRMQCGLADFSSLIMGCANVASLVRLGVVTLSEEAQADRLDRLFYYSQRPFTNSDY